MANREFRSAKGDDVRTEVHPARIGGREITGGTRPPGTSRGLGTERTLSDAVR